ncbi:MAG: cyclic nucleotide-binding domain-containing protein [Mariprofundaceae bacterium]
MTEPLPVMQLLRQARKAAFKKDFSVARGLYAQVRSSPGMADDLDVSLRFAYCAQQAGDVEEALQIYREVVETYRRNSEEGAAEALEVVIKGLQQENAETVEDTGAVAQAAIEQAQGSVQPLDDSALAVRLCEMGELQYLLPGDVLCREGDTPDVLWLLKQGTLEVQMPGYEEHDHLHAREGGLMLVGELGFFTLQRRSATLIAKDSVEVHVIQSEAIHHACTHDAAFAAGMERFLRDRWVEPVLAQHAVFERINDVDRKRLAQTFESVELEPGTALIEADQEHDGAYMVQTGCLFFMHAEDDVDDKLEDTSDGALVTSVFPGDMVHLGGLLSGYRSQYRVVAATPTRLLHLSREQFEPFSLRRPWIVQAILKFSRRPVHLQVMHPDEDYMWSANRHLKFEQPVS